MAADPSDGGLKCPGFATRTRVLSDALASGGADPAQHPQAQPLGGPDVPPKGMAERAAIPDPRPIKALAK
jgi:hypothetical protein